jgi:hypothetical protein
MISKEEGADARAAIQDRNDQEDKALEELVFEALGMGNPEQAEDYARQINCSVLRREVRFYIREYRGFL